ncbi:acetyltransferase [Vibrio sp. SM6]|uniref:Acetyltransferase n=1 Tax=Vibrio agarilyticus TaxID=2726741 RepID=A0A7X8TRM6_9VIBR|nr:DapH/DapD/GlmU-related protein [Vibrio agarilyticus]NLS13530.1 acetyltransferase [Vibrio agarilyticus]
MLNSLVKIYDGYGLLGALRLIRDVLITKCLFCDARIVRVPFYIRGKAHIKLGKNFTSGVGLRLDAFSIASERKPRLVIGDNCQVNDYVHIGCVQNVTIGSDVLIASKVFISDHNHGLYDDSSVDVLELPSVRPLSCSAVTIGNRVWIGENVSVLPGVSIGDNSIIGAGSVVTSNIPDFSIAVGAPARVVKKFDLVNKRWEKLK